LSYFRAAGNTFLIGHVGLLSVGLAVMLLAGEYDLFFDRAPFYRGFTVHSSSAMRLVAGRSF
jgi:hypothetical protein